MIFVYKTSILIFVGLNPLCLTCFQSNADLCPKCKNYFHKSGKLISTYDVGKNCCCKSITFEAVQSTNNKYPHFEFWEIQKMRYTLILSRKELFHLFFFI